MDGEICIPRFLLHTAFEIWQTICYPRNNIFEDELHDIFAPKQVLVAAYLNEGERNLHWCIFLQYWPCLFWSFTCPAKKGTPYENINGVITNKITTILHPVQTPLTTVWRVMVKSNYFNISVEILQQHHAKRAYQYICIIGDICSNKIVGSTLCHKGVILMLFYTEIQTTELHLCAWTLLNNVHLNSNEVTVLAQFEP
jgi:hypothetical protein